MDRRSSSLPPRDYAMPRYDGMAQALHWLSAILILAVLPLAWIAVSLPSGPERGWYFMVHKSVGVTILVLMALRLIWRATHPAPPLPITVPRLLEIAGSVNHWLLYLIFLLMPITGYLMSGSGRPVSWFGLFDLPALPQNDGLAETAETIHVLGRWAVYVLVLAHVAGAAFHVIVRRDGVLERMLPRQTDSVDPLV